MALDIATFLGRPDRGFAPVAEVARYSGDTDYVEGAIVLRVDATSIITTAEWDDVNWLWPLVVHASEECERTGRGETMFPDQPLAFRLQALGASGGLRVSLSAEGIDRSAVAAAEDFYCSLAKAGLEFFEHLERLIPGSTAGDQQEIETLRRWRDRPERGRT